MVESEIDKMYWNSTPLDVLTLKDHPDSDGTKALIKLVFTQMEADGRCPKQRTYRDRLRKHLYIVLLNLCKVYHEDPGRWVAYSRDRNKYSRGKRYHSLHIKYSYLMQVIDFLYEHEYIEHQKGINYPGCHKQSRMRATQALIDLIRKNSVVPEVIEPEDMRLVILRDADGMDIEYEDTPETSQMKGNLRRINATNKTHAILLYLHDSELKKLTERLQREDKGTLDFMRTGLYRVFNNSSFEQGGRFYGGWWQNIPREYRHYIRIDDKDVVECDYSGLHINMLYALEKLPMPEGDVYQLDGYPTNRIFRSFIKQMMLTMINSGSRDGARGALHKAVHLEKTLELPAEVPSTGNHDIYPLMDALEAKHEPIKRYFCSGKGIELQFLDSQIAEKVMLHFTDRMRYGILPMHDSFIIHHGLEQELKDAMNKAFEDTFGVSAKIDLKYNSIDERQKEYPEEGVYEPTIEDLFDEEYSTYNALRDRIWKVRK